MPYISFVSQARLAASRQRRCTKVPQFQMAIITTTRAGNLYLKP